MKLRTLTFFLIFIGCSAIQPLAAQVMSLGECIRNGLENNYALRIVRNDEAVANRNATKANAGYLPTLDARAGYDASMNSRNTYTRGTNATDRERNITDHALNAGIYAEWMLFDGYKIQTNYKRLVELKKQSANRTRMVIEDYVANLAAEYYNFVQQRIRMHNLRYAVALSKERLRIVYERYLIGNNSRLDLQQAQVDFNADSARSLKQHELLASSRIKLNELMAHRDINSHLHVRDTLIEVNHTLRFDSLWNATKQTNALLLNAAHERTLAELDLRSAKSRDLPYLKLQGNYGYGYNRFGSGNTDSRHNWGGTLGVTVGMRLFDGNRRRELQNAQTGIDNAELTQQDLELNLKANLTDLWQAYENNLRLLALEKENLVAAQENHYIACERYLLGNLPGIEMREAQKSLLDAEERILEAEYNTKICEISLYQLSGGIMQYLEQ